MMSIPCNFIFFCYNIIRENEVYCQFYKLKERPFNITSDPNFFFSSRIHEEALSHLHYGITQRKGILVVTGEIGTGKTTLCRFFLDRVKENTKTAFILNPYFSEIQLLEAVMRDFGLKVRNGKRLSFIWEFNKFLLKQAERGHNVVLIIDEAQNLKPPQLEQIRLLSNLETEKDKLIQIILVGQPELNQKLQLDELRQLRQRITVSYHIRALDAAETKEYIIHRLNIAGSCGRIKFNDQAIGMVANFSRGIPRLINIVCDRALLSGFVSAADTIDEHIINKCISELGSYFSDSIQEQPVPAPV